MSGWRRMICERSRAARQTGSTSSRRRSAVRRDVGPDRPMLPSAQPSAPRERGRHAAGPRVDLLQRHGIAETTHLGERPPQHHERRGCARRQSREWATSEDPGDLRRWEEREDRTGQRASVERDGLPRRGAIRSTCGLSTSSVMTPTCPRRSVRWAVSPLSSARSRRNGHASAGRSRAARRSAGSSASSRAPSWYRRVPWSCVKSPTSRRVDAKRDAVLFGNRSRSAISPSRRAGSDSVKRKRTSIPLRRDSIADRRSRVFRIVERRPAIQNLVSQT